MGNLDGMGRSPCFLLDINSLCKDPCPWGAAVPQHKGLDGSRSCPNPVMGSGAHHFPSGRGKRSGADGIHLEGSGIIPVNTSYALGACAGVTVAFQD